MEPPPGRVNAILFIILIVEVQLIAPFEPG